MITLECNYSKKLGLPQYSSHQFSVTARTEITDLAQVQTESAKLYRMLQDSVDASIKDVGYLPPGVINGNGNGSTGNGHQRPSNGDAWKCSPKQRELIMRIIDEHKLEKNQVEGLAQERFGKGVKDLNKLEASGLIEELLEQTGEAGRRGRFQGQYQRAGAR